MAAHTVSPPRFVLSPPACAQQSGSSVPEFCLATSFEVLHASVSRKACWIPEVVVGACQSDRACRSIPPCSASFTPHLCAARMSWMHCHGLMCLADTFAYPQSFVVGFEFLVGLVYSMCSHLEELAFVNRVCNHAPIVELGIFDQV